VKPFNKDQLLAALVVGLTILGLIVYRSLTFF
jgi:hypothetical protein